MAKANENKNEEGLSSVLVKKVSGEVIDLNEVFTWKDKLTPKQMRFVYFKAIAREENSNGAECARKAGYSEKKARAIASKLLHNPKILSAIEDIKSQALNKDFNDCKKEKKTVLDTLFVEIETGKYIDINREFDWKTNLTEKQRKFIVHYTQGEDTKGKQVESARRAGYSEDFAQKNAYKLLKDPEMALEIENIKSQDINKDAKIYVGEKEDISDSAYVELDTGEIVDLNKAYTWDSSISNIQKKFVFYYAYPFPNTIRAKGCECAERAGYKKDSAWLTAKNLLQNPKIVSAIEKIKDQISGDDSGENLRNYLTAMAKDIIARRAKVSDIDFSDYYNFFTAVTEDGEEYTKASAKLWDDIPKEKRKLIEGIDSVGKRGELHYKLPSKTEAENDILRLYKEYCLDNKKKDDSNYNVSAVYDLIKGKIETKVEEIKKRPEEDNSDYKETPPAALLQQEL